MEIILRFCLVATVIVTMGPTIPSAAKPCQKKSFGGSSFVCVCNESYCDTVEAETTLTSNQFAVYSTSKSGDRLKKTVNEFQKASGAKLALFVNINKTKQTIIGFGGTFTDAAGMNIASLPGGAQTMLIESYFGVSGIEYTLGRIPIASNDMSTDVYSYDFTNGDTGLSKFTIDQTDHLYKIPYIDRAVSVSRHNVSLYGSPWAPPDWMKTNDNMAGYGTILPNMAKVYANYLARFLSEYEGFMSEGRMWGITTQSGPTRSCINTSEPVYQSLCWTAESMRDWIAKALKKSIIDNGYAHIKVFTMDDTRDVFKNWTDTFKDTQAEKDIDGFAIQGYQDDDFPPKYLCDVYNSHNGTQLLLGSEFCIRDQPVVDLGCWERGVTLARRLFQDLQNCFSGFTDYNLAVDLNGGPSWVNNTADSPIIVDHDNKQFYKQPMFYSMGQFSKFITPGSIAVEVDSLEPVLVNNPTVAFKRTDGAIVVVIGNFENKSMNVEIEFDNSGQHAKFTMEADSISTVIWWP